MYNGRNSSIRAVQLQGGVDVQVVARCCDADVGLLVLALLSYWTMAVDAAQAAAQRAEETNYAKADAERNKFPCYEALETAPVQPSVGERTRVLGVVKEKVRVTLNEKEKEAGKCSEKVR